MCLGDESLSKSNLSFWYKKHTVKPHIVVFLLLFVLQLSVLTFWNYNQELTIKDQVNQESNIIALGIQRKDRSIVDAVASMIFNKYNADWVAVCNENNVLISFPVYGKDCLDEDRGFMYLSIVEPIQGSSYRLVFQAFRFKHWPRYMALLIINLIFMFAVLLINSRLRKHIKQDIIQPLKTFNQSDKELPIFELEQIRQKYISITNLSIELTKNKAIASTVTTLAHDVRRPFTLVQAVLDSFESFVKDPSSLKQAKQDIKQAINQVQGMISDIMDFSREVKLTTKPTLLEPVLLFSLNQVFQKELKAQISLTYQLQAKKVPLLDDGRITRVLANLIGNAVEAITVMGEKSYGEITFTSKDITIDQKQWVEINISNDGPPFPEGVEQKLFESFFTSGKNSGTGLGLASCQKIVKLHCGSISAKNLPDKEGVVFTMLIPASDQPTEPYTERLPPSNQAIWKSYEYSLKTAPSSVPEVQLKEQTTILLLEDEALYKAWVRQLINGNDQLRLNVLLLEASNVPEAISIIQAIPIHYAIVDIDLNHAQTGFDFLQFLQNEQIPIPSLVHSNRTLAEFQEKALSLGAKSFTPKPLPIGALITFLQNYPPSNYIPPVTDINDRTPITSNSNSFSLYYSDDSSINHRMFEYMVEEFNANHQPVYIEAFSFMNGETLLEAFKQKPADVVLTDQNMGPGTMKGLELLKTIHAINPNTHLYVLSNEDVEDTMPQVKELGGHGAFEPPWRVKILENIYLQVK